MTLFSYKPHDVPDVALPRETPIHIVPVAEPRVFLQTYTRTPGILQRNLTPGMIIRAYRTCRSFEYGIIFLHNPQNFGYGIMLLQNQQRFGYVIIFFRNPDKFRLPV